MPSLKLPPALKLITGLGKDVPLEDPGLPSSPVSLNLVSESYAEDWPDPADPAVKRGSFSVSADAKASVAVINGDSDPDPMGYLNLGDKAQPAAEKPTDGFILEPPLKYDPTQAYLVITGLGVTGKLTGKLTLGSQAALGLDGSGSVDLSNCFVFPRQTTVWGALTTAAGSFRSCFSEGELLQLPAPGANGPVQVVSFGLQGNAKLNLKLTAQSLAASVGEAVNKVLNKAGPFAFSSTAAATVTFTASVEDAFRVYFYRDKPGTVVVALKKSSAKTLGVDAALGLTVSVKAPELDALVDEAFAQAAKLAGKVTALDDAADPQNLAVINQIGTALGITDVPDKIAQAAKDKLKELRETIAGKVAGEVTAKFAYSWKRMRGDSLIMKVGIPDTAVGKYLGDILAVDLQPLLEGGPADGVVFHQFMGKTVIQQDLGFGFTFGWGDFTFLKSWDSLQTKFVELTSRLPDGSSRREVSFLGKRAYAASWFGQTQTNFVELEASTLVPGAVPTPVDFGLGLAVTFSWKGWDLGAILTPVADTAALIRAAADDQVDTIRHALEEAGVKAGVTGDATVSLTMGDNLLRQLLPLLASPAYAAQLLPHAMARALAYHADYPERTQVDRRMTVYGQVFADFLATESPAPGILGKLCNRNLPNAKYGAAPVSPQLIKEEANNVASDWTAERITTMADRDGLREAVLIDLPSAWAALGQRVGDYRRLFPAVVTGMSRLAAQAYGTRVLGSVLVLAASVTPGALPKLKRSLQIKWTDAAGQEHSVTLQQGTL